MSEVPSVFHQLGFEDADELVIKSELVSSIHAMIKARNLTQEQAAKLLGMPRPEVSHLMRGRISRFTIDRLVRAHNALDPAIQVTVTTRPRPTAAS